MGTYCAPRSRSPVLVATPYFLPGPSRREIQFLLSHGGSPHHRICGEGLRMVRDLDRHVHLEAERMHRCQVVVQRKGDWDAGACHRFQPKTSSALQIACTKFATPGEAGFYVDRMRWTYRSLK